MNRVILNIILLISVLFLGSSCSNDDNAFIDNSINVIKVSTGEIYPAFSPEIRDYYISSLNTLNTIQVTLEDFTPEKTVYINNTRVTNINTDIKLNIGEDIIVKFKSLDEEDIIYTIHYLPIELPKTNLITKNNPSDGYIFINLLDFSFGSTVDFSYIAILNNDGFPVYYKRIPYKGVINFKSFETPAGRRYSYSVNDINKFVIMNTNFEEIEQIDLIQTNSSHTYKIENHDFIYINDNHYIVPGQYLRENVDMTSYGGSSSVKLVEFVFQEIVNNQVVFEWKTEDHPELLTATDPIYYYQYATRPKVDYFHFNSLTIDPNDQNFILSARHTNQIYKINRTTGEIIWRFGGNNDDFNLTGNKVISHPHHATILANGNLLLFDNGVTKTPQESRIVEYNIDENSLAATIAYEYTETGRYSDIMGSAQKLQNGNYFIGWGGNITSQINANKSDITEIDTNGNIILDLSFTNNPNRFTYSYRAMKYNINF